MLTKKRPLGFVAFLAVSTALVLDFPASFFMLQVSAQSGDAYRYRVLAQGNDARKAEADRLFEQGKEQFESSQFEAALQSWQQALDIYQEIKDHKGEGAALGNLGAAYLTMADYPKAIEYQQRSLKIAQKIKNRKGEGQSLGNLGIAYDMMGNYPEAIKHYEQYLKIAQEIKDLNGEGRALGNLGIAYGSMGDYPKAIEYQQRSLKIFQEIKDRDGEGRALGNIGNAYGSIGDYPKAIEYQQQSLKIAQEIKDRQGEGQSLGDLGNIYLSMGDYPKAIEYQQQRLKIDQEIKDRKGEGIALGHLGNVYLSMGDYPKAIENQQQSLKIAQEIKDLNGEGRALGNLGIAYGSMRDYSKAIEYYQRSLKIFQKIKYREGEGAVLGNIGRLYYHLGDYPKAIENQQQSLKIAQEIKDREKEGISLNNLGFAYYKVGNLQLAESTLFSAIRVLESLRGELKDSNKITIFDTQLNTYINLQNVLISQKKTDAALEIAERGRARAFVELLISKLSSKPNEQLFSPPNIDKIKQIVKSQNATLIQYSIIYDDFKDKNKVQSQESELYIWVIKPTGEIIFRKKDLKSLWQKENTTLNDLVDNTRLTIGVRSRAAGGIIAQAAPGANQTEKLQKLHQLLIKPIANLLPNDPNNRVIFIPQRGLFLVPFPALKDEKGKFLIEKHTILTAPSIQVLDLTHKQKQRTQMLHGTSVQNVLVVGNPTMPFVSPTPGEPPQQLPSLPGAELEALDIARQFNTHAFIGKQATKKAIAQKMPSAQIIHFATHGILDDYRGLGSSLAFAPEPSPNSPPKPGEINGLLTAEEILDMKLQAELVVLSACDTGRGRITGDGVIGLSRSFITAGVPSIMVSLWSVPDAPTASLMTNFYTNFKQRRMDKAQALRQAMLTILKKHPSPRDWAAFTLIGESE